MRYYHAEFFDADGTLSHNMIGTADEAADAADGRRFTLTEASEEDAREYAEAQASLAAA